jgi:thioredoxin 1
MKKLSMLLTMTMLITQFTSCDKKDAEAQVAENKKEDCASRADSAKGCAGCPSASEDLSEENLEVDKANEAEITFVELGSVNCIPCKQMQPVMEAIEKKYAGKVNVIFYDVWTEDGKKYGEVYGIRLIPTQVFLDKQGKELFRHEGFFPEAEIDKFLQKQGLNPKTKS